MVALDACDATDRRISGAKAAALAVAEMRGVPTLGGVLVGVKAPFDHHHRHRTCRVPSRNCRCRRARPISERWRAQDLPAVCQ